MTAGDAGYDPEGIEDGSRGSKTHGTGMPTIAPTAERSQQQGVNVFGQGCFRGVMIPVELGSSATPYGVGLSLGGVSGGGAALTPGYRL